MEVWTTPSGVVLTRCEGYGSLDLVKVFEDACDDVWARGKKVALCHEWTKAGDYDPAIRSEQVEWCNRNMKRFARVEILSTSRLVKMGVSTVSVFLALKGLHLKSHPDMKSFLEVVKKCL